MKKLKDSTKNTPSKKATTQEIINKNTMRKLRKQFNYYDMPGETNNSPSLTVPDQTLGIKELLNN